MTDTVLPPALRIGFVSGVTLRKWTRAWGEQYPQLPLEILPLGQAEALAALHDGSVDIAFVRLPFADAVDVISRIRLYGEVPTLVVPRDSSLSDRESLELADLDGLDRMVEFPPAGQLKDAVALVGAGVGSLRLPHSLARLHARKDVVAIPIEDAPETEIVLAWPAEVTDEATQGMIEDFIGVVRGRTASSSRGRATEPARKATQEPAQEPARRNAQPSQAKRSARAARPARPTQKRRPRQGR